MTQDDRNSKDFDVLAYMRSLSPSKDEKFICKTVSDLTACWLLHYCGGIKDSYAMISVPKNGIMETGNAVDCVSCNQSSAFPDM